MFIRFVKPLWLELQREAKRTGKTIPAIVHEIVANYFNIKQSEH